MTRLERRTTSPRRSPRSYVAAAIVVALCACGRATPGAPAQVVENGSAARGRTEISAFGCGACHSIPGVRDAAGMVGPPLEHWSQRRIIAGRLPNDPAQLIAWITLPQSVEPGAAMPNMGVTDAQARDIAAYLYTLR